MEKSHARPKLQHYCINRAQRLRVEIKPLKEAPTSNSRPHAGIPNLRIMFQLRNYFAREICTSDGL